MPFFFLAFEDEKKKRTMKIEREVIFGCKFD